MKSVIIGGAVCLLGTFIMGCASTAPLHQPTVGCDAPSTATIATNVRERNFAATHAGVQYVQGNEMKVHPGSQAATLASATVEDGWIVVDGAKLWAAPASIDTISAMRDGENVAVVIVSGGALEVGIAGRGVLRGPLHKLGDVSAQARPDISLHGMQVAVTWDAPGGAHVALYDGSTWVVRPVTTTKAIVQPTVAPTGGGRYVMVWREGDFEHSSARGQFFDQHGQPIGMAFDPAPGEEVIRADVAAKEDGTVVIAALVATSCGVNVVARSFNVPM